MAIMGGIFGVVQIGVTAGATETGDPSDAGLMYTALGAGSAAASIAHAWVPSRIPLRTRYRFSALGLLTATTLLPLGGTGLHPRKCRS